MDINNEELKLTDLIDKEILQKIQDGFSNMSGMAALTTEANGTPVTSGSNFSDFCMKYTRRTEVGRALCEHCDSQGASLALEHGESVVYFCHAGLLDFAAPIMAENKMVGCFIGGQVLTEPLDLARVRKIAAEIGVEEEEYVEAVAGIKILEQKTIDNARIREDVEEGYAMNIVSNLFGHKQDFDPFLTKQKNRHSHLFLLSPLEILAYHE